MKLLRQRPDQRIESPLLGSHERLAGSAIHRIGYERWLRNLAVGLGNAPKSAMAVDKLKAKANHPSALVREHVAWALARQNGK